VNSTLKSLVFWMVLIVVGVLIWNFSSAFQTRDREVPFSEFMQMVDTGQVGTVTLIGNEVQGISKTNESFRTYAPPQFEGLGNKLTRAWPSPSRAEHASRRPRCCSWPRSC
jgi:cell division protease FtsH